MENGLLPFSPRFQIIGVTCVLANSGKMGGEAHDNVSTCDTIEQSILPTTNEDYVDVCVLVCGGKPPC